eukprot:475760-Amphidinium_carterae.1
MLHCTVLEVKAFRSNHEALETRQSDEKEVKRILAKVTHQQILVHLQDPKLFALQDLKATLAKLKADLESKNQARCATHELLGNGVPPCPLV